MRRTALIKSNNPHLAGGEKHNYQINSIIESMEFLGGPTLQISRELMVFQN